MVLSPAPSLGGKEPKELFHNAHSGKLKSTFSLRPTLGSRLVVVGPDHIAHDPEEENRRIVEVFERYYETVRQWIDSGRKPPGPAKLALVRNASRRTRHHTKSIFIRALPAFISA
jgi:hypothetical protein